jgi:hypothetical protein
LKLIYTDFDSHTSIQLKQFKDQFQEQHREEIFQINGLIRDIGKDAMFLDIYSSDIIKGTVLNIDTEKIVTFKIAPSFSSSLIKFNKGAYVSCKWNHIKLGSLTLSQNRIELNLAEIEALKIPEKKKGFWSDWWS